MSEDLATWLRSQVDDDETLAESDYDIMISARKVRDAVNEIARLRAEQGEARGYLSRLLQFLYPSIEILPDMLGVCTQIDNVLAGRREEITRLRAELATARREGMGEAAQIADSCAADWSKSARGKYLETKWDYESRADAGEEIAAAIRAAAKEEK